jgi:hypothetical protein
LADPADSIGKVVATLPSGVTIEPPPYEFPDKFFFRLDYPTDVGPGGDPLAAKPVAVDANGVPLPVQPPMLPPDPSDPSGKVAAILPGGAVYEPPSFWPPPGDPPEEWPPA